MQRMPLEKRLLIAGPAREDGPAAFRLYAATYFQALSGMGGGQHYGSLYNTMAVNPHYEWVNDSSVMQIASHALSGDILREEADGLLFRTFVEPFCDRKLWKGEKG